MLSRRHLKLLLLLTLGFVFLIPDAAYAQRPGGGRKNRPGAKNFKGNSKGPRDSNKTNVPNPGASASTFKEFEPVTDEKEEDLLGIIKVKPLSGGGILKLNVRRDENLKVLVGDRTFDIDPLPEFLSYGLYCTATWAWDKRPGEDTNPRIKEREPRRTDPKRLESLRLDTIQIEGVLEDISGDIITIKATPINSQQWPDVAARMARNPEKYRDKEMRITSRTLRLRIIDGITAFKDAADKELSLGDFEIEQKIQAAIVYAGSSKKRTGILVDLSSLTAEEREEGDKAGPGQGPRRGGDGERGPRRPRARRPRRG